MILPAYGQIWVKNSDPNELYFTTGDGNDIQLTSGSGIAGAVSAVTNGANNRIAVFSGTDTLNGDLNFTFGFGSLYLKETKIVLQKNGGSDGEQIVFNKTRDTNGLHTIVQDNDRLGIIEWYGSDGITYRSGRKVFLRRVNGTPGSNNIANRNCI